ncbi:NFX1-type zinc finger-containing protein [Sphaerulina musiva]
MAPGMRPCMFFQMGKCTKGAQCTFAHVVDPNFKRKACQHFIKGKCHRGQACTFSHDREDIDHLKIANGATGVGDNTPDTSEARLRDFRWQIPRQTTAFRSLGPALGKFFQQALELASGEVGAMQEMVTLLTSPGGMLRIDELLQQPFDSFTPGQLTRVLKAQLMPFFKIFTHPSVTSSVLLRAKVTTVYNIIYTGDGSDHRVIALFATLAAHLSNSGSLDASSSEREVDEGMFEAFELTLAVLSKVVGVNTLAHANPGLVPIVETFAAILDGLPENTTFAMHKVRKDLERLQQRLGIGQALPDRQDTQRPTGARATFQLARELPGELSEEGRRHDNDYVNIDQISILPTLEEIQNARNEYLPIADPREWHFGGILGLVDRHFRLLREDTVGQLRDAAKLELERLQHPERQFGSSEPRRPGARTYVYENVYIVSIAFEEQHGIQIAMRFARPEANNQQSKDAREEWWESSKRLGPEALICLLSSEGSATFFVVAPQGPKPTKLQKEFDLASDFEHAYIVARPVKQSDTHSVLSEALGNTAFAQLSIVEFPGVLLPSFEPTLQAMQRISKSLDMPFSYILAPTSTPQNPDREVEVQPPTYATKPGFKYDLSSITSDNQALYFALDDNIVVTAAQLAQKSTLDPGQALAVISALARSLAAIQGPPGTGKSYCGTQLIRILLANKEKTCIGPILICTQTNHALDAILERLVDDGVSEIVRIGGRSKSERLQDVNLKVLSQRLVQTKTEKSQYRELSQKVKEESAEISKLLETFGSVGSQEAVELHLFHNHQTHYQRLFGNIDEDGFSLVRHQRSEILDVWLKAGLHSRRRPRSITELRNVHLNLMSVAERRTMFNSWVVEMKDELHEKLRHAFSAYDESKERLNLIRTELKLRVLRQANIIGITTSGLARNLELLQGVDPKVLVCEEAGEVLEAHMLTAILPSIEHCILIGDHQQLRPQVQNFDLSIESHNGGQYALDVSLFERLVQPQDLLAQPLPFCTLEVQRRMHPSVSQLVRQTQYPNLQDDPSVSSYPGVVGMRHRLFWMRHEQLEDNTSNGQSTSRTNAYEVEMIAALVKHLAQQGTYHTDDIAVITPYLGQLRKFRMKFGRTYTLMLNDKDIDELEKEGADSEEASLAPSALAPNTAAKGSLNQALRLATIDNFQGEEAKVVIVSLVRSNAENRPGFLKTPNRINVLLSRAQHGMYIIGNAETMESVPMWHDVIEIFRSEGNIGEALELCCPRHQDTPMLVQNPADFARLSPEAGCNLLCEKQLDCGHACVAKCHSDMLHQAVFCMKPCTRLKQGCEHLCPKPCGDTCDRYCNVSIGNIEDVITRSPSLATSTSITMRSAASLLAVNSWLAGIFAKTLATSARLATTAKSARPTMENASRSVIVDTIRAIIDAVSPATMESHAHSASRVCGEDCPDTKFCQEHGSDHFKEMQADLLMLTSYKDVDLDEDPCIFTPCGHVFTIDSLDGTMGMYEHYEIDPLTRAYIGLKDSAEPFSLNESKPCPECRGSLRSLARYGRIVRRALLDESAKKLTAWSHQKHQKLANRLADIDGELKDSLEFPRKPCQVIELHGSVTTQIKAVKQLKTTKRYRKIHALIEEICHFVKKLSKEEQPYQRVHDLVEIARRQSTSDFIAKFQFSSEELQMREHLQAANLLIRSYLILFGDVISVHDKTPAATQGSLQLDLTAIRVMCEELITNADESQNVRQRAEAQVLWAKFAAIECGVLGNKDEAEGPGSQHRMDTLRLSATEHLEAAMKTCDQQAEKRRAHRDRMRRERPDLIREGQANPMHDLIEEASEVRRMLRDGISSTEMRMVVTAMSKEFSGTGHWYRCVNGHPFTVGECGMPMQLALCPECGANVGGQSHRPTEGVTHANDIEEEFGGLTL